MKRISFLLALCLPLIGFCQKQTIATDKATYDGSLWAKRLNYLQWVQGTDNYMYYKDNNLAIFDSKGTQVGGIDLQKLSQTYSLKGNPTISYIDANQVVIEEGNKFHIYDYVIEKPLFTITLPENAQNAEYNHTQRGVAYTLDNNLFLATAEEPRFPIAVFKDENIISGQFIHRNEFGIQKGIFWSPNGNYIAFYQKDVSQVTDYPLVDINTTPASVKSIKYPMAGGKNEIAKVGVFDVAKKTTSYLKVDNHDAHYLTNLAWTPDEKQILLAEVNRGQNHCDLNTYNRETGEKNQTLWKESNSKWVEPETAAIFIPNHPNEFIWLSEKDGFMNLYVCATNSTKSRQLTSFKWVVEEVLGFDAKGENVFIKGTGEDPRERHLYSVNIRKGTVKKLTTKAGAHSGLLSDGGRYLLDIHSAVTTPYNVSLIDINKNTSKTFYEAPNPNEKYDLGTVEFLTLKADDGTPLYAKMVKPRDFDPNKKYPTLLYCQGGPQSIVSQFYSFRWNFQLMASQGYIIIAPNRRGLPGFGVEWNAQISGDWGGQAMRDYLSAIDDIAKEPYVDKERLGAVGASYGGYSIYYLAGIHQKRFKSFIAHCGVFNLQSMYGTTEELFFNNHEIGGAYWEKENAVAQKSYKEFNPIEKITEWDTPILIIHGGKDYRVPEEQGFQAFTAAQLRGIKSELLYFPDENHWVLQPQNGLLWQRTFFRWLKETLK